MPAQRETETAVLTTVHALLQAWMQPGAEATDRFLAHVAEDFTGLGTGTGDYYPDRAAVGALIQREKEHMPHPSTIEVRWMNVRLIQPTLALAEGKLRSEIQVGTETHIVEPRCSFVLEERDSRWLLVHFHFSFADVMQAEGGTLMDALEGRNRKLEREVAQRTAALEQSLADLKAAQARLVQQQKMASLGALTAGIAHEIKNPLNFVNNFAALSRELVDELEAETDPEEIQAILADLKTNAEKIEAHGQRADGIIRAMLEHARGSSGARRAFDLNALVAEYVDLAWHGKRARARDFNVMISKDLDAAVKQVEGVPREIGQVLLNLIGNAFDAVYAQAAAANAQYVPTVQVSTRQAEGQVEIRVSDNGPGIPAEMQEHIFEPFFTTKPAGTGTGLGLSLSYDIITQGHGGLLTVESDAGQGATFIVRLAVTDTPKPQARKTGP